MRLSGLICFLFLSTQDACLLAMRDSHTWCELSHSGDTWLLCYLFILAKLDRRTLICRRPPLSFAPPPLQLPCSSILWLGSAVQHISCWRRLHICNGLGRTLSSDWKVDRENVHKSTIIIRPSVSGRHLLLSPRGACHEQQLLLETWHGSWANANTSSTYFSCGNFLMRRSIESMRK